MNGDADSENLIIVGSGPAGYTAAIYAARAGLEPIVIAGAVDSGGALMTTTEVENFPGHPDGVQGPELMEALKHQAERFGARILLDDAVAVDLAGDLKHVATAAGTEFASTAVILATGSEYRQLGLPDEERLRGRGVSWCATCDGFFFRERDVIVIGGGDSAMEEATFLSRFARSVTVVVRGRAFRASHVMAQRAQADPKITFEWHARVSAIHGQDAVTGVTLTDTLTGATRTVAAAGIFIAIGHLPRSGPVAGQVDLDADGYIKVEAPTTRTSVAGVFACGDVVDRRYRQAITAAGTGCAAALDAERYLAARTDAGGVERPAVAGRS